MENRSTLKIVLVLGLSLSLIVLWTIVAGAAPDPPDGPEALSPPAFQTKTVVHPTLLQQLSTVTEETPLRVILRLHPVGPSLAPLLTLQLEDSDARRQQIVTGLQGRLERSREALAPLPAGATIHHNLWIMNGLALSAPPSVVRDLATSPAVAEMWLDEARQYVDVTLTEGPLDDEELWGIARIAAPEVWSTLGISGTGAVVASMDTGVDYHHPALSANYRGNLGHGLVDHESSWFDPLNGGVYPYDDYGHGTHTLGTAVGGEGLGVAPGARWIAAKILSNRGYGFDSDIHAGFQWFLAPGGDPALAPDVVVCSWGSTLAGSTVFQEDIDLLQAAGIFPVFAAGNEGPWPGSLRSPASLPGVFAVGASDPYDQIASFSSRGPSLWEEIKPYIVAPGVNILSAYPGGTYASSNGTSMATPHVAGTAALLRSVSPTLSVQAMARTLTETAVPLTTTVPNNDSGWGLLDAYGAVVSLAQPAILSGTVTGAGGQGLAGAQVRASPHGESGRVAATSTDGQGRFRLALRPGLYDVTASDFGYRSQTTGHVEALTNTVHTLDFRLSALPTGLLRGEVGVAPAGAVPTRSLVLRALGTPVTSTVSGGTYEMTLPVGEYVVEARGNGYRVLTATVDISSSAETVQNFTLESAPTLLLVDADGWAYVSEIGYWRTALDDLAYAYDNFGLTKMSVSTTTFDILEAYDVVLWSSPVASPGLVNAGQGLENYLAGGGRLLLSGQDVAYFDLGASLYLVPQPYLREQIAVAYGGELTALFSPIHGLGPFAGWVPEVLGGDGADNQEAPDAVSVRDADLAERVWEYRGGEGAGVGAHVCTPYRALFFSFGFEAIAERAQRRAVMVRSLDWLMAPPPTSGLTLDYATAPLIASPGETVTHTVRVRHIGMRGSADSLKVSLEGGAWATTLSPTRVTLSPCASQIFTVTVTPPPDAGVDVTDLLTLTVDSTLLGSPLTAPLRTKTPAPVLLVDDERWYPMETYYLEALEARGVPFDLWSTDHGRAGGLHTGPLTKATLDRYPIAVWFTGYDWYAPVTSQEETLLIDYLSAGGRLFLSSQDFLYHHEDALLAERLGVAEVVHEGQVEVAFGVAEHPAGGSWGPVELVYPFRNWSDGAEPDRGAAVVARAAGGAPVALAAQGRQTSTWRSLFYAFPVETLPLEARADALSRGVGWLSPLGRSRWSVTPTAPLPGARLTTTLVLVGDEGARPANFVHPLPAGLDLVETTLPAGVTYDPGARRLSWAGWVTGSQPLTLTWGARLTTTLPSGEALTPTVTLGLPAWGLTFTRAASLRVAGADLDTSRWQFPPDLTVQSPFTLTLDLRNSGPGAASAVAVDLWLNPGVAPLTVTVAPTRGTPLPLWSGALGPGESRRVSVPLRPWRYGDRLRVDALLSDGTGRRWERVLWLEADPLRAYMPLVVRKR